MRPLAGLAARPRAPRHQRLRRQRLLGAAPGDRVVELHDERALGHEELYLVVRGAARFVIDGAAHDVPAGSVVHVRPERTREAFATEPDTAVLVIGAAPGEPFAVSPWETRQLELSRESSH